MPPGGIWVCQDSRDNPKRHFRIPETTHAQALGREKLSTIHRSKYNASARIGRCVPLAKATCSVSLWRYVLLKVFGIHLTIGQCAVARSHNRFVVDQFVQLRHGGDAQ
jgi:hypothetical protein